MTRTDLVIDRWLRRRSVLLGSAAVLLGALLALSAADPGGATWLVVLAGAVLAIALAGTERGEDRRTMLALALVGGALRALVHAALVTWTATAGGPFLGPDSSTYFFRSVLLSDDGFRITDTPALHFGTYDAAHYYLFAAIVGLVGPDLIALQAANWSMTALAGPLAFAVARRLVPAHARAAGLLVAIYPSMVAISVNDLLKDPSVICASLVAVWALTRLATSRQAWLGAAGFVLAGTVALSYVRMSRFYVAAFLLTATLVAIAWAWWRARSAGGPALRPAAVLSVLLVFGLSEAGPRALGWPYSPVMLADQFSHVLNSPSMRFYAPGLMARLASERGADGQGERAVAPTSLPGTGPSLSDGGSMTHTARDLIGRARDRETRPRSTDSPHTPVVRAPVPAEKEPSPAAAAPPPEGSRLVRWATNGVRKLFGPFPWVPPPDLSPRTITQGDYLLFPGMLVWYAVLPIALASMLLLTTDALRGRAGGLALGLVLFSGAMLAVYLLLNLSWRQREFMFPFLVLLAFAALDRLRARPWTRYAYAAYWFGLVALAVAHTVVRARVG